MLLGKGAILGAIGEGIEGTIGTEGPVPGLSVPSVRGVCGGGIGVKFGADGAIIGGGT